MQQPRRQRLAFLLLDGLDHFAHDLVNSLPQLIDWDVQAFRIAGSADFAAALAWADQPGRDALWFEFCWPPFPQLIHDTDFAGRRVIVRVHRIEAMETNHVARTSWHKVNDVLVVSRDMAVRVRHAVPTLGQTTRLHVVHNGLDPQRFVPLRSWNRHRIGWCGLMTLRKNPVLALQVLFDLRVRDPRYYMHISSNGGEALATESFLHLARYLDLVDAVHFDGKVPQHAMPEWHAQNGILLHTSLHESFGYSIAEAAAVGCDIAVLEHPGADEFWPSVTRYATVNEAVELIRKAAPHRWRNHVAQSFSLAQQLAATAAILEVPSAIGNRTKNEQS